MVSPTDDPVISRLDAIDKRLGALEADLEPVREFYQQAKGILAAIRWIGSGTVIVIVAAVVMFVSR